LIFEERSRREERLRMKRQLEAVVGSDYAA
jgi:hypothetical protein